MDCHQEQNVETNYFACTLGQAQSLNSKRPHAFRTVNDFIDQQNEKIPHLPAPAAIAHLCNECNVSLFLYDRSHEKLAKETQPLLESVEFLPVESQAKTDGHPSNASVYQNWSATLTPAHESETAYLHHTSGTSSGLPKPIAQSHRAAVGVLPCLDGRGSATFTTTPLYHGGIADCFRAWTSDAPIWLFPGDVPITSSNIMRSLMCADQCHTTNANSPVKYFSSVPYVLQMLASEPDGLEALRSFDIVGVGGAALPSSVGDDLVQKGVNLISRFGSAECGFLMSSHRDYQHDKEWQHLRSFNSPLLSFEPQDGGLVELVIKADWPHMAKRNRKDGAYATADLFEAHSTIPNAWRYHSRADSQLTLITGKKFDPAPLEAAIATSTLLDDVLIFGNGKPFPGALLLRSTNATNMSDEELLAKLWPDIEKCNAEGQDHTKLSRSMLTILPCDTAGLEKSSKGTVMRRKAEERFSNIIEKAYQSDDSQLNGPNEDSHIPDNALPVAILEMIKSVRTSEETIPEDADLFTYGVDSVACMQIRLRLQKLLPSSSAALPLNVVYDCGSIKGIVKYVKNLRRGQMTKHEDEEPLMLDLVKEYSNFHIPASANEGALKSEGKEIVILTGATGALGAHILHQLRTSPSPPASIICLVRAATPLAAHERVSKSLSSRLKAPLPPYSPFDLTSPSSTKPTTIVLPSKLHTANLGLDIETYTYLAQNTTSIIHAAWTVNFTTRLRSFTPHLAGLGNLLSLSLARGPTPPKFLFISSSASVTSLPTNPIPERISTDPSSASPLGYSRSKWVAEQICAIAHRDTALRGHLAILRVGQLCGDTETGVWNASEAWPLMLSAGSVIGALPALDGEGMGWLGVDTAARIVLEIAASSADDGKQGASVPVFHILNPDTSRTWNAHLLPWARALMPTLSVLEAREWLARLEGLKMEHPAKKLLGLWRGAYEGLGGGDGIKGPFLSVEKTREVAPTMRGVEPVSEEHFGRMWRWVEGNVGVGEKGG
ncbi:MAG: hypothetical protein Q9195_001183 [Heterodermia aff. obscurata]